MIDEMNYQRMLTAAIQLALTIHLSLYGKYFRGQKATQKIWYLGEGLKTMSAMCGHNASKKTTLLLPKEKL